jgi:hypothetical protein
MRGDGRRSPVRCGLHRPCGAHDRGDGGVPRLPCGPEVLAAGRRRVVVPGQGREPEVGVGDLHRSAGAIPADGDNVPGCEAFPGASPQPFLEQLRGLAQMVSAETAMPMKYLGWCTTRTRRRLTLRWWRGPAEHPCRGAPGRLRRGRGRADADGAVDRDGADPGVTPKPDLAACCDTDAVRFGGCGSEACRGWCSACRVGCDPEAGRAVERTTCPVG